MRRLLLSLVLLAGCPSADPGLPPLEPAAPLRPLRVVVVDDAPLAGAFEREWSARTGESIEVANVTLADFEQEKFAAADVLIYPPGLLGGLAESRRIVPLDDETINAESFARRDLLPLVRQYEMRWGEATYAVPMACPRLALLYRTDLLAKLNLAPPTTWDDYTRAAERLSDRSALEELAPADDQPWSGTVEPLTRGWRSEMLLARAASSIRQQGHLSDVFDFVSMDALIDTPPFVAALENMQTAAAFQPADALSVDPAEARRRLLAGEAAMALTWLPSPQQFQPPEGSTDPLPLAAAAVPGSSRYYDMSDQNWRDREEGVRSVPLVGFAGRVASVAAGSPRKREAFDLLVLLAGSDWTAVARSSREAHPFRRKHLEQLGAWLPPETSGELAESYREYLDELELSSLVMVSPRVPGRTKYLAALDAAVAKVIAGDDSADVAAAEAAAAWDTITGEIGVAEQRTAYRRSAAMGR